MPGTGDDAVRLRSLLEIARAGGSVRSVDELLTRAAAEARLALRAASLSIEAHAGGGEQSDLSRFTLQVPVLVGGSAWGRLTAARSEGQQPFGEADVDFAATVASQVAAGIVQVDHLSRIEALAFTDALTGLANRRAVDDRLEADLAAHRESGRSVAIVLADINRLKQVNDSFGHETGDRLITTVAACVARAAATVPGSLAARIGGDEFCVLVSGEPEERAVEVAEALCRLVDEAPMSTGVSCGVASTEVRGGTVQTAARLLRLADAAQYRAKRAESRRPVVAGSTAPLLADTAQRERRAGRGGLDDALPLALETGFARLDDLAAASQQERLEAVGQHVCDLVDGAGWWLSEADVTARRLHTVSSSVLRVAAHVDSRAESFLSIGEVFALEDFPASERAVLQAGSFGVEIGRPGNDPAEETGLVIAGYSAMIAAGASDGERGWLIELFADTISLPVLPFEPVLRGLVAVAVAGAERRAGARPPVQRPPDPSR